PAGGYEAHVVDQAVIGAGGSDLCEHLLDGVALSQVHRVERPIVRPVGGARACDAGYGIAIGSQTFADAAADAAAGSGDQHFCLLFHEAINLERQLNEKGEYTFIPSLVYKARL